MKKHEQNHTECLTLVDNHTGCFLSDTESLFNGVLSSFYVLIATVILAINIFVLTVFFKKKSSSTTIFLNFSFVSLILFNVLSVLFTYFMAYTTCFVQDFSHFLCVFKYCVYYFIGHEINLTNFLISIERVITVKWALEYRKLVNKTTTLLSIVIFSLVALGLSSFNFATYEYGIECICALNSILSKDYILTNNFAFFLISISTASIYFYIYFLVKSMRKRVEHHRKSIGSSLMIIANNKLKSTNENADDYLNENSNVSTIQNLATEDPKKTTNNIVRKKSSSLNSKMKVLKVQTFVFSVFFFSWFPFLSMTTYEAIMGIKTYETLSKFRNFSISFILINGIVTPIVYTYRLKYMTEFVSKMSLLNIFPKNSQQANVKK